MMAGAVQAQTWTGGGTDDNFGTGANWSGGAPPTPGTGTILTFAGTTRLTPFSNYTAFDDFGQILFASGAGAFTISGNAIDLFGKIENNSTNLQTIALGSIGTGSVSGGFIEMNPVAGDLSVTSANVFLNTNQLRVWGSGGKTLTFGASTVISGTGGSVSINANSNVVFQSAHTYTGDTFINAGNLQILGGSLATTFIRLGDTTGTVGATLSLTAAGGLSVNRDLNVRGGSSGVKTLAATNTTGTNTYSGNVYLDASLTTTTATGGTLALSGTTFDLKGNTLSLTGTGTTTVSSILANSTGSGAVTVNGGTVNLNGANSHAGVTTLTNGTLKLGNATALGTTAAGTTVASGSVLDLNGQTVGAEAVTLNGTGISSGGALINSSGTAASLSGAVTLGANSSFGGSGAVTLSGGISGAFSQEKVGAGTATFSTQKTYTGGTTVTGGVLDLTGGGGAAGTIRGTATVGTGATLRLSTGDATGYAGGAAALTTINVNGGTLNVNTTSNQTLGSATINLTGGAITGVATSNIDFFGGGSALNTLASAATSTISGVALSPLRQGSTSFTVADGAAVTDLQIDSLIRTSLSGDATGAVLTKAGAGTMLLNNVGNNFDRNLNVTGGKITTGTTAGGGSISYLGAVNGTRTITIGTGASIDFLVNNIFGGGGKTAATIPAIAINGGTLNSTRFNIVGNLTLNGGTLAQSATDTGAYQGYQFLGGVTVAGTTASTISTGNSKANHLLGGTGTTFTVPDVTGTSAVDLTVSAPLTNASGDYGSAAGVLVKEGAGTMALSAQSSYTGGTTVNGGVLDLTGGGGLTGAIRGTVTVNTGATLRLSAADVTGYSSGADRLSTINLVGGTLNVNTTGNQTVSIATFNLTGATISGITGSNIDLFNNGTSINTLASATTSTISVPSMQLRQNDTQFNIADGAAAVDLQVSSVLGNGDVGNHKLIKNGAGTMALSTTATYTGGTEINGGVLDLTGGGGVTGTIRGAVTVNTGGTLRLSVNDATGYSTGADRVTSLNLNGGTLNVATTGGAGQNQTFGNTPITMTGGAITGVAGSNLDLFNNGSSVTTNASSTTSTISVATLGLRQDNTTFTVADGAVAVDLQVTSVMGDSIGEGNNALIKAGAGTMQVTAANTYTGATTVSNGVLEVGGSAGTLSNTASVAVSGGTLLVSSTAANRINDGAAVSLGGAAADSKLIASGAVTETVGALTLTAGSGARVIDFGAAGSLLTFASLASSASGVPLQIWNWSGTVQTGDGADRLLITPGTLGANVALTDITFYSDNGQNAYTLPTGWTGTGGNELAPIPEAGSVLTALLLLGSAGWRERRKLMRAR